MTKKKTNTTKNTVSEPQEDNIARIFSMSRTVTILRRDVQKMEEEGETLVVTKRELTVNTRKKREELDALIDDLTKLIQSTSTQQYQPQVVVQ